MNKHTKREQFTENAQYILKHCDLLIKKDCIIVDDVLYERLGRLKGEPPVIRFFFNCDDYDYLEDETMIDYIFTLLDE